MDTISPPETYTPEQLAALDRKDPLLAAHLRRQQNWPEDAKTILRGPSEAEVRRKRLLDDLSEIDNNNRRAAEAERKARELAGKKAGAEARLAQIAETVSGLRAQIAALGAEAKELRALKEE